MKSCLCWYNSYRPLTPKIILDMVEWDDDMSNVEEKKRSHHFLVQYLEDKVNEDGKYSSSVCRHRHLLQEDKICHCWEKN